MDDRPDERPVRLPRLAPERASALLTEPELAPHMAGDVRLAMAAAESAVPLLLVAPSTARPLLVVRALHASAHRTGDVWLCAPRSSSDLPAAGATCVFALDDEPPGPLPILEAHLDDPQAWIVVVHADPGRLPAALRARVAAVALQVPALAGHTDDVDALALATLSRLAERSGWSPAEIAPDTVAALRAHPWPGGRIEFESVLARALLLAGPGGTIRPDMLDLAGMPPHAAAPTAAGVDAPGPRLEYLLAELAHELRNPLVTVKTFAQQLPALLEDEALRTRFAELTDEAVTRMDTLLENVLDFARLPAPLPVDLDVGLVLDGVLGQVSPALAERQLRVRRIGGGARCAADRAHLHYALSNLLLGIAHETPAQAELVVDASVNGVVSLRFGTGAAITRLRDLTAAAPGSALNDPTFLPLAFTLARAVLERTGGCLGVVPDLGGQATVTVRLPPAGSPIARG